MQESTPQPRRQPKHWLLPSLRVASLIIFAALLIAFLSGVYDPLYFGGIFSLAALPIVLIAGSIYLVRRKKWLVLLLGVFLLPPAWVLTLVGCLSDYPLQPSHRLAHGVLLVSGLLAAWLYLLAFPGSRR